MTCASVNVTFMGPINFLSIDIIKFNKTACILYYKFGRSDILICMEFCFSGLFQGLSRLNQDFSRNYHFSGLHKAKSGLFRSFFSGRDPVTVAHLSDPTSWLPLLSFQVEWAFKLFVE